MAAVDLTCMVSGDFAKLGCNSLEGVAERRLRPHASGYVTTDSELDNGFIVEIGADIKNRPVRLWQINDGTPVFGIDTSNIVLGDTGSGLLCAVRGSVVWREKSTYQYVRYGPFIFHITERNRSALYSTLHQIYLDADESMGMPIRERTVEWIRSILERWLHRQLCNATHNSLILLDGSLIARINCPASVLGEILNTARKNQNQILAFSKETTISSLGRRLNDLIDRKLAPCLLDIDDAVRSQYGSQLHFFGRVYAAKLAPAAFTFRLDIDRRVSEDDGLNAVRRLLGNELLADGYPETLRLAHILSRFSASEALAMQRYVALNYGLRIDTVPDIRQALFGPYGGSSRTRSDGYDAGL